MAKKLTIRQTIVVEGRADVVRVREAVDCDIITTQGFRLSGETLLSIQKAHERVGVIVLTDPDGVGERIRRRIDEKVPGVWHCYLLKEDAREKGDIGIENASVASIQEAMLRCIELHTSCPPASSAARDSDRPCA
ncbi:MAG: ribonuclease M5, partial [Bacillota bacterium]|nr:ribonuclease M5 [Bacillota bacterium]